MTHADAVEHILAGDTKDAMDAHILAAWKFTREHGYEPSIDALRAYLLAGHGTIDNFWTAELKRRATHGSSQSC